MVFSLFKKKKKEDEFWIWFSKHEQKYFNEIENLDIREQIFVDLSQRLTEIQEDLVFEFSPIHESGIRELTISADGIKEGFPKVEELILKAPKIANWQFNAFRQRIPGEDFGIQYGDIKMGYSDIFFRYKDGEYGEIGIELNVRGLAEDEQCKNAVYILLDSLIGEYDVTMGIKWIEWVDLDDSNIESLNPIISLRILLDQKK